MKPSEWDACTDEDQAEMAGYELTISDMRAYEEHLDEQKRLREEAARTAKGA